MDELEMEERLLDPEAKAFFASASRDYRACQSRFAEAVSRTLTVDGMHDDEALEGVRRTRSDILQAHQIFLLAREELTAARKLAQDVLRGPDPPQS